MYPIGLLKGCALIASEYIGKSRNTYRPTVYVIHSSRLSIISICIEEGDLAVDSHTLVHLYV